MFDEELDPRNQKRKPKSLDNYSIDELKDYIEILKNEIIRVEADISKKEKHKQDISNLFKTN